MHFIPIAVTLPETITKPYLAENICNGHQKYKSYKIENKTGIIDPNQFTAMIGMRLKRQAKGKVSFDYQNRSHAFFQTEIILHFAMPPEHFDIGHYPFFPIKRPDAGTYPDTIEIILIGMLAYFQIFAIGLKDTFPWVTIEKLR